MLQIPGFHQRLLREASKRSLRSLRQSSTSAKAETTGEKVSWAEYLAVRKGKRRWELAATIPTTLLAFGIAASYFGSLETDPSKPIFGVDPPFVYAGATLGCAGLGYLAGPVIGNSLWRMTHRRSIGQLDLLDKQFHDRIVRKRADPSKQSVYNPVPDYYGEKIGSIPQYRQWLRDQAKYQRKANWQ